MSENVLKEEDCRSDTKHSVQYKLKPLKIDLYNFSVGNGRLDRHYPLVFISRQGTGSGIKLFQDSNYLWNNRTLFDCYCKKEQQIIIKSCFLPVTFSRFETRSIGEREKFNLKNISTLHA